MATKRSTSVPTPRNNTLENDNIFTSSTPQKSHVHTLSPVEAPQSSSSNTGSPYNGTSSLDVTKKQKQTTDDGTSPPTSSTSGASPDMSEGDKGGGIGFEYIRGFGDKSIVTTSSSKFVEVGQNVASQDPPDEKGSADEENESLRKNSFSYHFKGLIKERKVVSLKVYSRA